MTPTCTYCRYGWICDHALALLWLRLRHACEQELALRWNTAPELADALEAILGAEWMVTHDWGGDRPAVIAQAEAALRKAGRLL